MAITTFTASQVLTAAQMNSVQGNDYNQTVSTKTASYTLVAADKGTRVVMNVASANTVTVNTSLFTAGDTLVLQNIGAGVTTVTAGTATVSSAGPLAIPQYGSGTLYFTSAGVAIFFPSAVTIPPASSGLTLIAKTTFTAAASLAMTNVFSSTYDNYLVLVTKLLSSGNANGVKFNLGTSGTADTGSNYDYRITGNSSASGTVNDGASADSKFAILGSFVGTIDPSSLNLFFYNPNLAARTNVTSANYGNQDAGQKFDLLGGCIKTNTQYTDFFVSVVNGATTFTADIAVYGIAKS